MPDIRPFRALRYDPDVVGDVGPLVAPPYDVIGPELEHRLLERHPRNAVRLDLPHGNPGEEPDERYRRVARWLAAWRSDGTLRKDPRPSLYVCEQAYRVPGTAVERTQRGFFGRLRLEPFGPGGGVLPHERTLSGPREDRYRLLRATGVNTSPVVGLFEDPGRAAAATLAEVASGDPLLSGPPHDGAPPPRAGGRRAPPRPPPPAGGPPGRRGGGGGGGRGRRPGVHRGWSPPL